MRITRLAPLGALLALGGCYFLLPEAPADCTTAGSNPCNAGFHCDTGTKLCVANPGSGSTTGTGSTGTTGTIGTIGTTCTQPGGPCTFNGGGGGGCCLAFCSPNDLCCLPNGTHVIANESDCCSGYADNGVCADLPSTSGTPTNGSTSGTTSTTGTSSGTSGGSCTQNSFQNYGGGDDQKTCASQADCGVGLACTSVGSFDPTRCYRDCSAGPGACPTGTVCQQFPLGAHAYCVRMCDQIGQECSFDSALKCAPLSPDITQTLGDCIPKCANAGDCGTDLTCVNGLCACTSNNGCNPNFDCDLNTGLCLASCNHPNCNQACCTQIPNGGGATYCDLNAHP